MALHYDDGVHYCDFQQNIVELRRTYHLFVEETIYPSSNIFKEEGECLLFRDKR